MLINRTVNIVFWVMIAFTVLYTFVRESSLWNFAVPIVLFIAVKAYGSSVMAANFFITSVCAGNRKTKTVALTFDDGPLPGMTSRISDILASHQIKGAFFCIGQRIVQHPALVKQLHEQGHLIGNHSFLHGKLFSLQSSKAMSLELAQTDDAIQKITGYRPNYFRPPYGVTNPNLASAISDGDYTAIGWSVRSLDTMIKDEKRLIERVTKQIKAGDIILFHDYSESMINALPKILEHIDKIGLKVVRLDKLLS